EDAWSTSGKVTAATSLGRGDARAIAVGGHYFDFHPLQLLNGSYLTEEDLMQDRVLLDEDLAWLLFGGTELQGMELRINGVPFVVGGVIQREQDFASKKAYTAGMGLYMSYDGYKQLKETAGIDCYELVMAQPVRNFTVNFVREKFPIGQGSIQENTGRFSFGARMKVLRQFGSRSMQTLGVLLPYWENAARCAEDWCALLTLLAMINAFPPALTALVGGIRLYKKGREKLTEEWLPEGMEKLDEAIRIRQRRRWLKKHGRHE
ncbi:MAG: ABC transporter permease, partial [Oscillospiraceae bacterium]|nr:ABC transporter permease [Oscillospiraceae bacterium]